jgi:hypothetical protein
MLKCLSGYSAAARPAIDIKPTLPHKWKKVVKYDREVVICAKTVHKKPFT